MNKKYGLIENWIFDSLGRIYSRTDNPLCLFFKKLLCFHLVFLSPFLQLYGNVTVNILEEMKDKIHLLENGMSYTCVDLGLTSEELNLVDQLQFDQISPGNALQYHRFGDLPLLKEELICFLKTLGNNSDDVIKTTNEVILRTVQNVVYASNKNSAWVCVRAFTPITDYDIPRWHMDGNYFGFKDLHLNLEKVVFKFAATLKGSSTLLYNLPEQQQAQFNAHRNDRIFLSQLFDLSKAESPKRGEGVFFRVADYNLGAIHSEPKITENRLFFSILVGDQVEIEELYSRWHPKN